MGFRKIREKAIEAIRNGRVQHEARGGKLQEKNLFLAGDITQAQVIRLLTVCRGTQYTSAPHHMVPKISVHIFKPESALEVGQKRERWYIKLYFLEPDVWFISFHRSSGSKGEMI